MTDMSPSERLQRLYELNERERQQDSREIRDGIAFLAIGLTLAAVFIWFAILGTMKEHQEQNFHTQQIAKDQGRVK